MLSIEVRRIFCESSVKICKTHNFAAPKPAFCLLSSLLPPDRIPTPFPYCIRLSGVYHCRGGKNWGCTPQASSPSPSRLTPCHLSQSERPWQYGKVSGFAKGSPFGGAGASAPERASPVKLLQRRCDTMALTSRVRIAVCLALWQHPCPLRLLRRHLSQSERLWHSVTFSSKRKSVSSKTTPLCQGLPC